MTLGRISALVGSLIFGVVTLAAGTLLTLGGHWAGLLLWIPGGALIGVAMKINARSRMTFALENDQPLRENETRIDS